MAARWTTKMPAIFDVDDMFGTAQVESEPERRGGKEEEEGETDQITLRVPRGYKLAAWWYEATPQARASALAGAALVASAAETEGGGPELREKLKALQLDLEVSRRQAMSAREEGRKEMETTKEETVNLLKAQIQVYNTELISMTKSMSARIEAAFGQRASSVAIGQLGENITAQWLHQRFPGCDVVDVTKIGKSSDFVLKFPGGDGRQPFNVLIEVKNGKTITTGDVTKFDADIRAADGIQAAVLVALQAGGIPNHKSYHLVRRGNVSVAYLARVLETGGELLCQTIKMLRASWRAFDGNEHAATARLERLFDRAATTLNNAHKSAQKAIKAAATVSGALHAVVGDITQMMGEFAAENIAPPEVIDGRRKVRPGQITRAPPPVTSDEEVQAAPAALDDEPKS